MLDDRAYLVRWEYSYSSWTLFTCEIEMLLHVVSTAGEVSLGAYDWGRKTGMLRIGGQRVSIKFRTVQTGIGVVFIWETVH